MAGKRENYLHKSDFEKIRSYILDNHELLGYRDDDLYMQLALLVSDRSKDPSSQVGAVVVSKSGKIMAYGYNGAPKGMSDDDMPWDSIGEQTGELDKIKNSFVVHAERNAILNYLKTTRDFDDDLYGLKGATLYVTWFPCNECAKEIVQSGISKVVYHRMYSKENINAITRKIFEYAGVECVQYGKDISKEDQYSQRECSVKRIVYKMNSNKRK